MKLVYACLSARKDRERRFHHCGGLVRTVPTFLTGRNDRESKFHHRGGSLKLVQAS